MDSDVPSYTAFLGDRQLAAGQLAPFLRDLKRALDEAGEPHETLLVFRDDSGKEVDFDLRGSAEEVVARAAPPVVRAGPGRPRLGVVSREISLLPRHWEWLEAQPNGASAAVRRLVDEARRRGAGESAARSAIDAAGRVMTALAGNLPGFEEAYRALYAGNEVRLAEQMSVWPRDIQSYILAKVRAGRTPAGNG